MNWPMPSAGVVCLLFLPKVFHGTGQFVAIFKKSAFLVTYLAILGGVCLFLFPGDHIFGQCVDLHRSQRLVFVLRRVVKGTPGDLRHRRGGGLKLPHVDLSTLGEVTLLPSGALFLFFWVRVPLSISTNTKRGALFVHGH